MPVSLGGVDWDEESLWLLRRADGADEAGHDELWSDHPMGVQCSCVVRSPRRDLEDERAAALRLFEDYCRATGHCGAASDLYREGLVRNVQFRAITGRLNAEHEARLAAAREQWGQSELVRAARTLGLSPRPSGGSAHSWMGNCPGTNHWLMLQAESGQWGCGWCKRKGGAEELATFVNARKKRRD